MVEESFASGPDRVCDLLSRGSTHHFFDQMSESNLSQKRYQKARIFDISRRFATKVRICFKSERYQKTRIFDISRQKCVFVLNLNTWLKYLNRIWQSLLVCNAFHEASTGGKGHFRPFLLQIDTFGKRHRCLPNVCYLKLKKLRYLDKLR